MPFRSKSVAEPRAHSALFVGFEGASVPRIPAALQTSRSSTDVRRPRFQSLHHPSRPRTAHGQTLRDRLSFASFSRPRTGTTATAPPMPCPSWASDMPASSPMADDLHADMHAKPRADLWIEPQATFRPDIGVALGSPTHCVLQGRLQPLKPWVAEDLAAVEPLPDSTAKPKFRTLRAVGNLLGKLRPAPKVPSNFSLVEPPKGADTRAYPSPVPSTRLRHDSPMEPVRPASSHKAVKRSESTWRPPRLTRKSFSRGSFSMENLRMPKSPTWPMAAEPLPALPALSPPPPPPPPIPQESPRLRVNIPSTHFDRYSVMFSSLFSDRGQSQPSPSAPGIEPAPKRSRAPSPIPSEASHDVHSQHCHPDEKPTIHDDDASTIDEALIQWKEDDDEACEYDSPHDPASETGHRIHDFVFPVLPTRAPPPPPLPLSRSAGSSFSSRPSSASDSRSESRSSYHFDPHEEQRTPEPPPSDAWEEHYLPKPRYKLSPWPASTSKFPASPGPTKVKSPRVVEPEIRTTCVTVPALASHEPARPSLRRAQTDAGVTRDKPLPSPSQALGYDTAASPTVAVAYSVTPARAIVRPIASGLDFPPRSHSLTRPHDTPGPDAADLLRVEGDEWYTPRSTLASAPVTPTGRPSPVEAISRSPLAKAFSPCGSERSMLIDAPGRRLAWDQQSRAVSPDDDDEASASASGVRHGTPSMVDIAAHERRQSSAGLVEVSDSENEEGVPSSPFGLWRPAAGQARQARQACA